MHFKNKKITIINFLFLYLFLVLAFSFISYHFFITNFKVLETKQNKQDINIVLEKITMQMKHLKNTTIDYERLEETIGLKNKLFSTLDFTFDNKHFEDETKDIKEVYNTYETTIHTDIEDESFINTIKVFDPQGMYLFTLKLEKTMEILSSGKNTIFLFNIAIAILVLVILLILRKVQNDLSESNIKLERQVDVRTKKLKEYSNKPY